VEKGRGSNYLRDFIPPCFQAMREESVEEEQIAAAFFVDVVKQRLQLAAVIEAILDFYAEDELRADEDTYMPSVVWA
jgi:hypothetical protein